MQIKRDILWRIYMVFFAACIVSVVLVGKTVKLQYVDGEAYRAKADSLNIKYRSIEAERGNIYTEDGSLLAASFPFFRVAIDPNTSTREDFYDNLDSLAFCLAKIPGNKSSSQYRRDLINARRAGKRFLLLDAKATLPEMQQIRNYPLFRKGQYRGGLVIEGESRRVKPYGVLAHRTVGYATGEVNVGLEGHFNEDLQGVHGKRLMQKIAGDTWLPINDENEIEPRNGRDLISTIDIRIQDIAENALERTLIKHDAAYGTAVVMEVATGKIKAIANLTKISEGRYDEKFNYAVGEKVEPGSTFKLASALALLEDGHCNLQTLVDLNNGAWRFSDRLMKDSEGWHRHRSVSLQKAFEISSNVGISRLVDENYRGKPESFIRRLQKFHLDDPTGVEIPGEPAPYIKTDPSTWSGVTLPWMSVGYELQMTPLQMLNFYNTIANDGKMMKPYLVSGFKEYGELTEEFKPVVVDEAISSLKSIERVQVMLEGVVDSGTAKILRSKHIKFAGKTGTARVANDNAGYGEIVYQSSFCGYFPAEKPLYSCIVVVNAPQNGVYYGAHVAGPVFREVADKVYSSDLKMHAPVNSEEERAEFSLAVSRSTQSSNANFFGKAHGYDSDLKIIYEALGTPYTYKEETDWSRSLEQDSIVALQGITLKDSQMPSVIGMGLKDAIYLLENSGLQVKIEGYGKVRKQSIRKGQAIKKGDIVYLKLARN